MNRITLFALLTLFAATSLDLTAQDNSAANSTKNKSEKWIQSFQDYDVRVGDASLSLLLSPF